MENQSDAFFVNGDLRQYLRRTLEIVVGLSVDKIPKDQLLATPDNDIVDHIFARLSTDPLVIYEDRMETTEAETKVDVSGDPRRALFNHSGPFYISGYQIRIVIPFSGDPNLWELKPSTWQFVCPDGKILKPQSDQAGTIELKFSCPADTLDEQDLSEEIQRQLALIRSYVENSTEDVDAHNSALRISIEQHIKARKERLLKMAGLASRLGLPVKKNPDAPSIEPLRLKRNLVRPLPPAPESGFEPEPGIDEDTYEHILSVVRHELRTSETTPNTYAPLCEEDLRNILLAHLNGHYEGNATGETFRKNGKTDIRIEDQNRAAFVAECKIWRGAKEFRSAILQLLNYLTWRDCKAALVIFNKNNRSFRNVESSISNELPDHELYKRELPSRQRQGEWRCVFRSVEDDLREVIVHIFAADLFHQGS